MTLELYSVTLGYDNKSPVLTNISLSVPKNKIIAFLGVNGCGKSTAMKAMANILKPFEGKICLEKKELASYSNKDLAKKIGYLPQTHNIIEGITVYDFVAFGRTPYLGWFGKLSKKDCSAIDKALKLCNIEHLAHMQFHELSGGQRQAACIAMTIAQDTDFILLDEPTTYLDLAHQLDLMSLVKELQKLGKTIIMVLHDLNQAFRYCDYLFIFGNKQLLGYGTPEVLINSELLNQHFNLHGVIEPCPISCKPTFYAY